MQTATLWPLVVCAGAVIVLVTSMLALSYVLGQRHQGTATGQPYESGIVSTGSAGVRLSAEFYLVAMFFVIFDLEVVGFIGIVLAALVYLWRQGALDRGAAGRTMPPRRDIECQRHCVRPRADGHPGIASSALHLA
jgi:NADH-quinone oxidoreductase subunit A